MPKTNTDKLWRRNEIASPCVKICIIHPRFNLCLGCYRTPTEIARWSQITSQERQAILCKLNLRSDGVKKQKRRRRKNKRYGNASYSTK